MFSKMVSKIFFFNIEELHLDITHTKITMWFLIQIYAVISLLIMNTKICYLFVVIVMNNILMTLCVKFL